MAKGKYEYWLSEDGLLLLEGWAREGLTDELIADKKIGIATSTLYEWKKKYPEISEALKKGKEIVDFKVESALLKRALGFYFDEIIRERLEDTGQKKRHGGEQELTEKEWELAKAYFGNTCAYCGKSAKLTKDHIDPLANGGKLTKSNTIPVCGKCNSSKRDKQWMSWYQKQPFYEPERAQKIMDYVQFAMLFDLDDSDQDAELVVTKVVKKYMPPDVAALIFWLKNRKPDKWRDKPSDGSDERKNGKLADILEALTDID